jgi:hypothetical protein
LTALEPRRLDGVPAPPQRGVTWTGIESSKRDQLEGKIQERYGYAKDQTKKDIDDWYNTQKW